MAGRAVRVTPSTWRLVALLGFALVAPAGLPAGGADWRLPELRRRQSSREPLLSVVPQALRCAPRHQAPAITCTEAGVPLRVLRRWIQPGGERWLQVEVPGPAGVRRGWLAG
ncbi:SH3 domain-containing protein [Cyanobium sp. CH-040]|uniref:SH3 domain-containing protein n=1 Tax=Cyanobium sp. CH-040 TaxID=2823708 RepID=UPI0020CFE53A|nr:SH3 domain-containing protein [Cyanobium sp. CH-040]MCP9927217.1 SH3 domain-containing protein [Cyanobium sp. CH-040]